MIYLIDTNIGIYVMEKRPARVFRRLEACELGDVGVSAITVSELQYGVSKSEHRERNEQRLREFLMPFEVLPYDERAAQCYGDVRSDLERRGGVIGPLDLLIAAHALSRDLVLVTNRTREFGRVEGLRIENWVE